MADRSPMTFLGSEGGVLASIRRSLGEGADGMRAGRGGIAQ